VLVSTARMKVLHLVSRYRWTGCAEPAVNLCRFLAKEGADARLCCVPGGSLELRARELGAQIVPAARLGRDYTPWGILRAARSLARHVARERIDLIHAHTSHDHWLAALSATVSSACRVPLIRTHHETRRIRTGRVWRRIFNRHTAMNVTVSEASRRFFVQSGAIRPERVRTIHGGLDFSRFRTSTPPAAVRSAWGIPPKATLIAHLSHIGPDRRQDRMLEAFGIVAEEFSSAWLVFLGQGNRSTVRQLREKVGEHSFASRVLFSRDFSGAGIAWLDQVAAVDQVAVLAVGSEGSSRGVMEAMGLAKPVAGARTGVIPELIDDGETGWLVDPDQPLSIAGALREMIRDPALSRRTGSAAAAVIKTRFRCERQAREMMSLYQEILAPPPGGSK
jgi:L-malate glycosyltransferase